MSYGKAYFRQSVITGITTGLIGLLFYVLRVILYGRLSAEDYGLFYALISACMLLQPIFALGFDPGIVPFVTRMREQRDFEGARTLGLNALACQTVLSAALAIPAALFAQPIADHVFHAPQAAALIRILALFMVFLQPFKTVMSVLLGLQFIGLRNLTDLSRVISVVAITALLLGSGFGVLAAAWAFALSAAIAAVLGAFGLLWLCPDLRERVTFRWDTALLFEVFNTGKHMAIAFGGITVFSYMDTVMLTLLGRDLRAVAAYQLAAPTLMLIYSLILAAVGNFMPMVTTLWHRGEKGLLADGIGRIYEAAIATLLPAGVLMACFCDVIIRTLFRGDILNAPDAFNILAVGSIFFFICYLNVHILCGMGRARAANATVVIGLAANLLLNLALIPLLSVRGAAIATVVSYAAGAYFGSRSIRGALHFTSSLRAALASALVSLGVAAVAYGIRTTGLFALHPESTACVVGPVLFLAALGLQEWLGIARLRELIRVALLGAPQ
ncbi:MAG: oligosaccharide flippase family protein [Candidatus Hydrogenedentes bacterium]|nr:oligosaccharide flippase family protein [Candidatus Hydrogenedentota bacterium]